MKRIVKKKYCKLLDFQVYDNRPVKGYNKKKDEEGGEEDEEEEEDNEKDMKRRGTFDYEKEKEKKDYIQYDTTTFVIQMYGIDEKGNTCSIFVENYHPFFYIKCDDNWNDTNVTILLDELRQTLICSLRKCIISAELVQYNKLYGFTAGKKSQFIKMTFQNNMVLNKIKYLWYEKEKEGMDRRDLKMIGFKSQSCKLELYESNLPPLLRFFHIHNISPSGWICLNIADIIEIKNEKKITTCKYEYKCKSYHVLPQEQNESMVPYKICSFDIEASSSHGDFPIPMKTYKRLSSNMIDQYTKQYRSRKTKKESIILIHKMIYR